MKSREETACAKDLSQERCWSFLGNEKNRRVSRGGFWVTSAEVRPVGAGFHRPYILDFSLTPGGKPQGENFNGEVTLAALKSGLE